MGLLSSIKSFLGLDKKEESFQEVSNELFLETVKQPEQFPVTTPDPVVVDTKDVNETLNVKVEEPKKEKKVIVKKEGVKEKPVSKKPVAEKQKQKKTK